MLLICPQEIGGRSVDDKFFRNKHEKEGDCAIGDSQTVFERMLKADWEKVEISKESELMSLEIFNVTYSIHCYEKNYTLV